MKYILAILLLLHGLIHLLGTAKAFEWGSITQLSKHISKTAGLFWLAATVLFITTVILFIMKKDMWWLTGGLAIILSQVLITSTWTDAKYGTIANVIILLAVIVGFGDWSFHNRFQADAHNYLGQTADATGTELLTDQDIQHLPEAVQRYIRYSGSLNKPKVKNFRVEISGRIRKNEESAWMPFTSVQYNFLDSSVRLFYMSATMNKLPVKGYHKFVSGSAFMDIRLFSLVKVQYQEGREMDISETVTFFNDMCCMAPATLTDSRVQWLAADNNKVKASFTNNGISITAWLYFDENGALVNFISDDRYALTDNNNMERLPWLTPLKDYKSFNGYTLPGYADLIYSYPTKKLCYGNFTLENIEYNNAAFRQ